MLVTFTVLPVIIFDVHYFPKASNSTLANFLGSLFLSSLWIYVTTFHNTTLYSQRVEISFLETFMFISFVRLF